MIETETRHRTHVDGKSHVGGTRERAREVQPSSLGLSVAAEARSAAAAAAKERLGGEQARGGDGRRGLLRHLRADLHLHGRGRDLGRARARVRVRVRVRVKVRATSELLTLTLTL